MQKSKLYAFSGLMFAGKDYVAEQAKLKKCSMSAPICVLAEALTGYSRKDANVPGVRRLWQQIGQWGWGSISEEYPITPERVSFIQMVRTQATSLLLQRKSPYAYAPWDVYGSLKSFWIDILLQELAIEIHQNEELENLQSVGMNLDRPKPENRFAIVNIRFEHELDPAEKFGFQLYHVMCSEETRRERMAAVNYNPTAQEANDASEAFARSVVNRVDDDHVIWNDYRPMPQGKFYHTVETFVALVG